MATITAPFQPSTPTHQEPIRSIVFKILNYQFALPITRVAKVVNCPVHLTQAQPLELLHFGQHTITVLNLHHALGQAKPLKETDRFLVVVKTAKGEAFAIATETPPDLIDIAPSVVRSIPASYQKQHSFYMADYVAVLPDATNQPIFLLNLERAIEAVRKR